MGGIFPLFPGPMIMPPASDRNLLFGILALQRGFIRPEQLIAALHAWALTPNRPLADFLVEQRALDLAQRAVIDSLVAARIGKEPSPSDPTITQPLARYIPEQLHAQGGMGEVFRARDVELNRIVALKQMRIDRADDLLARELFRLEAETTGNLEHPGIVPVYGLGANGSGRPCYAMRFIRGESLADAIARFHGTVTGPWEPADRALALRQLLGRLQAVCQTIAYAHSRGILHRDLKPSNIMLGRFGETLVVDWGLAWPLGEEASQKRSTLLTSAALGGQRLAHGAGSPAYMAPEQRDGDPERLGPHTDVYLLGGILYEILTGGPPHPRGRLESPSETALAGPGVPPGLAAIARRALAPLPADRQASAEVLGLEIERWLAEEPLAEYRLTLDRIQTLVDQEPDVAGYREELARQHVNLGLVLGGMNRPAEAEQQFRQAAQEYERLANLQPDQVRYRAALGAARAHLARVLAILGRAEEAEQMSAAARADFERLLAISPHDYRLASVHLTLIPGANLAPPPQAQTPSTIDPREPGAPESPAGPAERTLLQDTSPYPGHGLDSPEGLTASLSAQSGFAIERVLGQGGASRVYLGQDRTLGRRVAIKTLLFRDAPEARARFLREARIMAMLEHANVCPVHAVGESSSDGTFIVMRYIPGDSLAQRVRNEPASLPAPDRLRSLLRVLIDACRGLAHAHARGIIHRDPKPANILIGENGEGIVIDWGLARVIGDEATRFEMPLAGELSAELTQEGTVMGTPVYMPPEVARGAARSADARSDIYTLGGGLFEILTGRPPFGGSPAFEILQQVQAGTIPRPRQYQPAAPAYLDAVCARAMARDPADRYPSADALADDIQRWLDRPTGFLSRSWGAMNDWIRWLTR